MKSTNIETQKILESLRTAVSQALEKKKRLGQYAVVWDGKKPVVKDFSFTQARSVNCK